MPRAAAELIENSANQPVFSVVSLWELVIKQARRPPGLMADAALLRQLLLGNGYDELPVSAAHVLAVGNLPPIHGDPFDRLVAAQAISERMMLLTADADLARYPGSVRRV